MRPAAPAVSAAPPNCSQTVLIVPKANGLCLMGSCLPCKPTQASHLACVGADSSIGELAAAQPAIRSMPASRLPAEPEETEDDAVLHRLCPTYAQDINSPFRHVRTRIYFTSESHMHSLLNVLRFCQLGALACRERARAEGGTAPRDCCIAGGEGRNSLLSPDVWPS